MRSRRAQFIVLSTGLWAFILTPQAFAYVTPEQVLRQTEYQFFVPEEEENTPNIQRQRSKGEPLRTQGRPYSELSEEEKRGIVKETPDAAAAEGKELQEEEEQVEEEEEVVELSPSTVRLLERLERLRHKTGAAAAAGEAPLAPTGPETLFAMGALLAGIVWTMRRARRLEQR